MIVGEEMWIGKYSDEYYDPFFKKFRKNIKKTVKRIVPPIIYDPLNLGKKQANSGDNNGSSANAAAVIETKVNQAVQAKEAELKKSRENLLQEVAEFEEVKVKEQTKLNEEKLKTEQEKINQEHGEDKKMLYIGLAALGGLIIIGGIIVYIKSRQNQLAALNIKDAA